MAPSTPVTTVTPVATPVLPVAAKPAGTLQLPILVFGVVEVRRLKRELEALEEYMAQASTREPGKQPALPRVSRLLDALASENHLNLLQSDHCQQLKTFLLHVEREAPVIHMSFATDPSSAFTAKIVTWLRVSIAPDVLLEVGLQPTIAAGAIVRTTNKIFDLSLRDRFDAAGNVLLESLEEEAMAGLKVATASPQIAPAPADAAPQAAPRQPGGIPGTGTPVPQEPGAASSGKPDGEVQAPVQSGVAQ